MYDVLVSDGEGYKSWLHTDDAAEADDESREQAGQYETVIVMYTTLKGHPTMVARFVRGREVVPQ
jgi:hypothetical protein